jgi:hypothetical protein
MIEEIPDLPPGVTGYRATGTVTPSDYRDTVLPALKANGSAGATRLLFVAGMDFEGYSGFEQAATGAPGTRLDRIAFVSDRQQYADAVKTFGWPYPEKAQVYPERSLDRAVEWLAED